MTIALSKGRTRVGVVACCVTLAGVVAGYTAPAHAASTYFSPGNLVVSRSVYDNKPGTVEVGTILPPDCAKTTVGCGSPPVVATNNGTYPFVWNNNLVDGSFGITSKIFRPDHSLGFACEFAGGAEQLAKGSYAKQRSYGHQLQFEIGVGAEPLH
jgi:hypothetical protein